MPLRQDCPYTVNVLNLPGKGRPATFDTYPKNSGGIGQAYVSTSTQACGYSNSRSTNVMIHGVYRTGVEQNLPLVFCFASS